MATLFVYVLDRDFGFAPNPFHGSCTLATCKPKLRSAARVGDWIVGVGGSRLNAAGRCIFGMQVSRKITFDQYWTSSEFHIKRPVRNGSKVMMVGDNIYHHDEMNGDWTQADSHHSNPDGTPNITNLNTDTSRDAVLISHTFVYFGSSALEMPKDVLAKLKYRNSRNHRRFDLSGPAAELISWLVSHNLGSPHRVLADPFDFEMSGTRFQPKEIKK